MGAQGPTGLVGGWTAFRDVWFDSNQANIRSSEMNKVSEVATYMRQNPSLKVGINDYADPRGTDAYNQALGQRRVDAVRDALINAGLPANKIQRGTFGESRFQCNESIDACRRVGVLSQNRQLAQRCSLSRRTA
jgi:outer membrane protein OmpA-like peptidoglycan-associated protein